MWHPVLSEASAGIQHLGHGEEKTTHSLSRALGPQNYLHCLHLYNPNGQTKLGLWRLQLRWSRSSDALYIIRRKSLTANCLWASALKGGKYVWSQASSLFQNCKSVLCWCFFLYIAVLEENKQQNGHYQLLKTYASIIKRCSSFGHRQRAAQLDIWEEDHPLFTGLFSTRLNSRKQLTLPLQFRVPF